jgi:glucosyl-3-phosphoglycerate phosphatase
MAQRMKQSMANTIILWRHGQTDWNVANKFQGHTDIPLNAVGEYQVAHAARNVIDMKPTAILSSDLIRAQKTAQALADLNGLPISVDARLRETNCGKWEGLTGDEIRAVDHDNLKEWSLGGDNPAGGTGDRRSEVGARAQSAIEDFLAGKDNQTLIVATHGGTARAVIGMYLELPIPYWSKIGGLSNASWSVLSQSPKGWLLTEHNAGSIPETVLGQDGEAVIPDSIR